MKPTSLILSSMLTSLAMMTPHMLLAEATGDAIEETEILGTYKKNDFVDKEKHSLNVVDTLDSKAIERFGDSAAGDALKRVVGVSLVDSKYAVIRGLKGRFISNSLNGSAMPSLNPTRREVALDIFPASILGGIEVEKSYRPELPSNTTGGMINLVTKDPGREATNKLSLGLGATSGVTGQSIISYKGSKTDILGFDGGIRELPSSIDNATDFGSPDKKSSIKDYGHDFNQIYNTETKTATPDMNIAYAYGDIFDLDSGSLSLYGSGAYSNEWKARQDATIDDNNRKGNYERSTFNIDQSFYVAAGFEDTEGNHQINSKSIYLHQASDTTRLENTVDKKEESSSERVILEWIENTYLAQQFSGSHLFFDNFHEIDWHINYGHTHRYEPDRRSYEIIGRQAIFSTLERRFADMTEASLDASINYHVEFDLSEIALLKLKTGLYALNKDRDADLGRFSYDSRNFDSLSTIGKDFEQLLSDKNILDGNYDASVTTLGSDNYTADEQLTAAYISTTTTLFEDIDILLGARLEDYQLDLSFKHNSELDNSTRNSSVLPVAALTYRVNDDWQVKGSVSQTLSRPGITERSESKYYDPETDDLFFGESTLKASDILNYDLRADYFFDDRTNVSLALFYKAIDKPIEISFDDASGSAAEGYTFVNQEKADLFGVEIDFAAGLFETNNWSGFMNGNLSVIDTEVTLADQASKNEYRQPTKRQLQGQSEYLANLQIGIDHIASSQALSLSANYFSDRIHRVERFHDNKVEEGRIKVDLVYQWNINDTFEVKAKAKNIFNTPIEYAIDDKVIESYKEGVGFSASVGMNF